MMQCVVASLESAIRLDVYPAARILLSSISSLDNRELPR